MILNPGTQHFDFAAVLHGAIVVMSLYPTPGSAVADLNNNPAADTTE